MIITCPECETRYTVKAAAFKAPGRKVRCASCGNEWFQEPPEDAPAAGEPVAQDDIPAPPVVEGSAEPESDSDPESDVAGDGDALADAGSADAGSADGGPADDGNAVVARAREAATAREKAKKEKVASPFGEAGGASANKSAKRSRGTILGWTLLVGFVAALVGALLAFRGDIVRFWPATAAIYDAIGMPAAVQIMEFRKVGFEVSKENGLTVLSIQGEIVNVAEEAGPVPRVRVALRDKLGNELYHYFFAIPEAELAAGATAEFVSRLSSPPAAAVDLVLRFVEPGEYAGPEAAASDQGDDAGH